VGNSFEPYSSELRASNKNPKRVVPDHCGFAVVDRHASGHVAERAIYGKEKKEAPRMDFE
jgi:hypothetical protein